MNLTVMPQPTKIQFDNERLKNALNGFKQIVENLSSADIDDEELRKVKIFQKLNPVYQAIYYLYHLYGGTEAAEILGVSRTYVYKIVGDVNAKLKQ